jgi:hypothetical protein
MTISMSAPYACHTVIRIQRYIATATTIAATAATIGTAGPSDTMAEGDPRSP